MSTAEVRVTLTLLKLQVEYREYSNIEHLSLQGEEGMQCIYILLS